MLLKTILSVVFSTMSLESSTIITHCEPQFPDHVVQLDEMPREGNRSGGYRFVDTRLEMRHS